MKFRVFSIFFILISVLSTISTFSSIPASEGTEPIPGTVWTKYEGNPLTSLGQLVLYPCVIYDGTVYKMWYPGHPAVVASGIYYATSVDGITWIKHGRVLEPGSSGSWDAIITVSTPSVIYDGLEYKMWYSGYFGGEGTSIGYATSSDGATWMKYEQNPVLRPGPFGTWDDGNINLPTVLFDGSTYMMWYTGGMSRASSGLSDPEVTCRIGLAISPDGILWTKFNDNPVLQTGDWDNRLVYTGCVIKEGSEYKMWYTGRTDVSPPRDRIGFATSTDGKVWTKPVSTPVLEWGSSGSWDARNVATPWVVRAGNQYMMWYYGAPTWDQPGYLGLAASYAIPLEIQATIDVDPDTLNLRSNGQFITAYIELPAGYNPAAIDLASVKLDGVSPIIDPAYSFVSDPASYLVDHNGNGIMERIIKLDREAVRASVTKLPDYDSGEKFQDLTLTVTGTVSGIKFVGSDLITIIAN